jgi:hypothetical protein
MKKNIGTPGRLVRLGLAIVLFGFAYYKMSWILALAGLFVLYEAIVGWCFFKNSCSK